MKPPARNRLADAVADRLSLATTSPWTSGVVKSISGALCVVTILGDDYVDIHRLASYTPTVGDVVYLLSGGGQLFILGKAA